MWNYNEEMLQKAGIAKPFSTYEEFIEHCVKAKKDGHSRYPVLWVAGVGLEQLPGTWYALTWNRGGTFFDKQGNHQLGAGSVARETLKWWANTFEKGLDIADPESLKVQFTTSAKVFGAGKNLYRGPNHHYGLNVANDKAQSSIAGKVKVHGFPGDGRTIGVAHVYFLSSAQSRQGVGLEAAAVSRRQDQGRPVHASHQPRQGCDARLRLQLGNAERCDQERMGAVGRRRCHSQDVGQGDLHRHRRALALPALAFPLDRSAQHRGPEVPDRPDHRRPVLRQPDQGNSRRQAEDMRRGRVPGRRSAVAIPAESKADAAMAGQQPPRHA